MVYQAALCANLAEQVELPCVFLPAAPSWGSTRLLCCKSRTRAGFVSSCRSWHLCYLHYPSPNRAGCTFVIHLPSLALPTSSNYWLQCLEGHQSTAKRMPRAIIWKNATPPRGTWPPAHILCSFICFIITA